MKEIKWGLVGCGDISQKRVAPAMRDLANHSIRGISRKQTDKLAEFAEEFGAVECFSSAEELILSPDIDAVYLATPVNLHCAHTLLALENGKHVLCEKPMAMSVAECDRMVETAKRTGRLLGIAYYRRFYPAVLKIKELIAAGQIGRPVMARALACEFWSFPKDHPLYWHIDPEQSGGGPLMDFGSHRIDIIIDIMGQVRNVAAFTDKLYFDHQVEDSSLLILRHGSGAHSTIGAYHSIGHPCDELEVFGSEGRITIPVLNEGEVCFYRGNELIERFHCPPHDNLHLPLVEDFGRAIIENRPPGISGETGRLTSIVMEAAYRASRDGVTVRIW